MEKEGVELSASFSITTCQCGFRLSLSEDTFVTQSYEVIFITPLHPDTDHFFTVQYITAIFMDAASVWCSYYLPSKVHGKLNGIQSPTKFSILFSNIIGIAQSRTDYPELNYYILLLLKSLNRFCEYVPFHI